MAASHGGKREGAGRKPKAFTPQGGEYTAESYLQAVVRGTEPPDVVRVAAARSLLRFELPVRRAPPVSPSARELARRTGMAEEHRRLQEFERKAAKTRAEHYAAHPKGNGKA